MSLQVIKKEACLFGLILSAAIMLQVGSAQAGQDRGGGGAMVCRDSRGEIKAGNAWLLDLWEGENLKQKALGFTALRIVRSNESFETQVSRLINRVAKVDQNYAGRLQREIYTVWAEMQVSDDITVNSIADANPPARRPGCHVEQLAHYTERYGILVQKEIWDRLSTTDQVALLFHEAVYKTMREAPIYATTSDDTRPLVAFIFSTMPLSAAQFGRLMPLPLAPLGGVQNTCKIVIVTLMPAYSGPALQASGSFWDGTDNRQISQHFSFSSASGVEWRICGTNSHEFTLRYGIEFGQFSDIKDSISFYLKIIDKNTGQSLLNPKDESSESLRYGYTGKISRFYLNR